MLTGVPEQSESCVFCDFILSILADRVCADLTEPIDIYSEWIDAADEAEKTLG